MTTRIKKKSNNSTLTTTLYPNNDGIDVVLDFRNNDWIVEGHKIPSEYNGAPKP